MPKEINLSLLEGEIRRFRRKIISIDNELIQLKMIKSSLEGEILGLRKAKILLEQVSEVDK